MDRVMDIFAGIAAIALVTTIVSHKNTASIISNTGKAYSEALRAAMGQ
jgi:hypothetical protein